MVSLMIFDLTGKYIMMLYFLLLFASFATFQLYHRYLATSSFAACQKSRKKRTFQAVFYWFGNLLYAFAFVLAFVKNYGTDCTTDRIYRKIFGLIFYSCHFRDVVLDQHIAHDCDCVFVLQWVHDHLVLCE